MSRSARLLSCQEVAAEVGRLPAKGGIENRYWPGRHVMRQYCRDVFGAPQLRGYWREADARDYWTWLIWAWLVRPREMGPRARQIAESLPWWQASRAKRTWLLYLARLELPPLPYRPPPQKKGPSPWSRWHASYGLSMKLPPLGDTQAVLRWIRGMPACRGCGLPRQSWLSLPGGRWLAVIGSASCPSCPG